MAVHIAISSLRIGFFTLLKIVEDNVVILFILEIIFGDSFPSGQFLIDGFNAYNRQESV